MRPTADTPGSCQCDRKLRLITCGGVFDRVSGNYLGNVVVYARMTVAYR